MSAEPAPTLRSHVTLALCTALHAFTHAYGTMLVPLYLLIVADLKLPGVKAASLVLTVYGLVYCLGSFGAGVLADRTDRKTLLGIGLIGNAVAILLMGLTRRYEVLLALAGLAGLAGTLFHPAANALVTAHYPKAPGMAIGFLGVGAGVGFFAGPQYAGWRAETAHWSVTGLNVADWQRPCVEAGLAGLVFGLIFLLVARESRRPRGTAGASDDHPPLGAALRWRVVAVAFVLALRDFAGVATLSLAGIYLLKAAGLTTKQTGLVLGSMMLIAIVINPLAVWLSSGRRRLVALPLILVCGGVVLATVPHFPMRHVLPVLCAFQAFHLASYALSEAAVLERVAPAVRGRVVGLFLTIAGTIASSAPWLMGKWTDSMGGAAWDRASYVLPFAVVGGLTALAAVATPLIRRLGEAPVRPVIDPVSEITPATIEPVA